MAKVNRSFRFSKQADEVLKKQENATRFIEELILGKKEAEDTLLNEIRFQADRIIDSLKGETLSLKNNRVPQAEKVEPVMAEQFEWDEVGNPTNIITIPACCLSKSPCKHWQWDSDKLGYVNSISGEFREVVV